MRRLYVMDKKDYDPSFPHSKRPSVRALMIRDGKIAMVHSTKFDYYKLPGGGIEEGESHAEALIREVKEETGLTIIPSSIKEFGSILRLQKSELFENTVFEQESFHYICEAEEGIGEQSLVGYEAEEGYTLVFVTPEEAIAANEKQTEMPDDMFLKRENIVLKFAAEELIQQ